MMSLVFPEWMPLWAQLLVMAFVIVFGLAFLMMPFAVFGVKGRLAELELQLQDIQAETRAFSMRLASWQGEAARPTQDEAVPRASLGEGVYVEEIRPPEPARQAPVLAPPALTPLRAPKVSDAYEPRKNAPPVPNLEPEPAERSGRRMPWHEQQKDASVRQEPLADVMRRHRAPDADQPPYRPDFSQPVTPQPVRLREEEGGRSEPVLNWPSRRPADR